MSVYLVTFKPAEPYYFGNEKSLSYKGQKNGGKFGSLYFVRSEQMPSQSTLLGALRYLVFQASHNIGNASFNLDQESNTKADFGDIKKLSPVFIARSGERLIPTPLDHQGSDTHYTPLREYQTITTADGMKLYALAYDAKIGLTGTFLNVDSTTTENAEAAELVDNKNIFGTDIRVGINLGSARDGFFKKEYAFLKNDYAFALYAQIDQEMPNSPVPVFLGQGKSAFSVTFQEQLPDAIERFEQTVRSRLLLNENEGAEPFRKFRDSDGKELAGERSFLYFLSDAIVPQSLYENTLFAIVKTKEYRAFTTAMEGERVRVTKGQKLHHLVKAGSILIVPGDCFSDKAQGECEKPSKLDELKNPYAETIGMNTVIGGRL